MNSLLREIVAIVLHSTYATADFSLKLLRCSLLVIAMAVVLSSVCSAAQFSVRVSDGNDDAEEQNPTPGSMNRTSTDLELAYDGNTRQIIGIRFQDVNVPTGVTINSAYIRFTTDELDSGTTDVVIYGEAADNPSEYSSNNGDITVNRTKTSAFTTWSIPAWNTIGETHDSPDLTAIIQEIINQSGWAQNNSMAFIIEPAASCNSSACRRTAESYNGSTSSAPLLVIDYDSSGLTGEKLILSTTGDATLGGLNFNDDDLVEYDLLIDLATNYIDGIVLFNAGEDIDAAHILDDGHIVLSTQENASIGGISIRDDDLVEYDPDTDTGTLLFDGGAIFENDEDIDAVFITDGGNIILSVKGNASIGSLSFADEDLVEYDPNTGIATLFFDGSAVYDADGDDDDDDEDDDETIDTDAVHIDNDGHILLSTVYSESINGTSFGDDDIVEYDPSSGTVTIVFNGGNLFSSSYENVDAITKQSTDTTVSAIPFGFNCVESGLDALTGNLYTKTVGQSFSVDVAALKDSDSDGAADAVETDYASDADKTVSVELIDTGSAAACPAYPALSPAVSQSLVFTASDAGRKASAAMSTNVAYRSVGCRVTDNTDIANPVVGCSTDSFAVRPTAITVSSNMTNSGSTGAPTAKAGANFTLTATASAGYDGTPNLDSGKLEAHAAASQTGTVSGVFGAADPATGIATGPAFTYTEVGNIRYLAEGVYDDSFTVIDQAGGDCTNDFSNTLVGGKVGCKFGNTSATDYFGLFAPDHFTLSGGFITNRIDRACAALSNFTYMDEYFQAVFSLSAKNLAGNTTQNYVGAYAKLDPTVPSNFDFTALNIDSGVTNLTSRLNIRSSTGLWVNGIAGNITADLAVTRLTNPDGPYASLNIGINPVDGDGVILDALDLDEDQDSVNDHAAVGQTEVRFGRLNIANAHGSELLTLPVPLTAQYYSGSGIGFVTNTDDSCTAIAIGDLSLSNNIEAGQTDGDINIQASPNIATQASLANPILSTGGAGLSLCPPGNPACTPAAGNTGYADIEVTTPAYLQFDWFGTGPANPRARASFGLFKGRGSQIFMREVY